MNYIFLGPPGSGKGTQAKKLAEKLDLYYFGTGDLMREAAEQKTSLGLKFQEIWNKKDGSLIPDELVTQFIDEKVRLVSENQGIVLDGYPRTLAQAQDLEKLLPDKKFIVININVGDEDLIKRMSTRRICSKCDKVFFQPELTGQTKCDVCSGNLIQRQDDQPEVLRKRIMVYNQETEPLINYYQEKNILINIDGEPSIDQVQTEIWEKVNAKN